MNLCGYKVFNSVRHYGISDAYLNKIFKHNGCLGQWDTHLFQVFTSVRHWAISGIYLSNTGPYQVSVRHWAISGIYLCQTWTISGIYLCQTLSHTRYLPLSDIEPYQVSTPVRHWAISGIHLCQTLDHIRYLPLTGGLIRCLAQWNNQLVQVLNTVRPQ